MLLYIAVMSALNVFHALMGRIMNTSVECNNRSLWRVNFLYPLPKQKNSFFHCVSLCDPQNASTHQKEIQQFYQ